MNKRMRHAKQPIRFSALMFAFIGISWVFTTISWASEIINTPIHTTPVENTTVHINTYGTAKDWQLTDSEWAKYLQLMQSTGRFFYPNLPAPAVLGMYADNPEEEKHFAEIYAKQEHDKVARELSFNKAAYQAMQRLYPDEPVVRSFDRTPFNPASSTEKEKTNPNLVQHLK